MPQQFHPVHRLKIQIHQQQIKPKISPQQNPRRLRRPDRRLGLKSLLPQNPSKQFPANQVIFNDQGAGNWAMRIIYSTQRHDSIFALNAFIANPRHEGSSGVIFVI